jgi:hypothetical protein
MDDHRYPALAKFSGLGIGILLGGILGPIAFPSNPSAAATLGCFLTGALGYLIVSGFLFLERRRRDRELFHAAQAVRREARLSDSIEIKVRDGRIVLEGVVADQWERIRAEEAVSTLPGTNGVTNRIQLGGVTGRADEVARRVRENLIRMAEESAKAIHVQVEESRVVLEGTVHSSAEALEAEESVSKIPGIAEVENRLQINPPARTARF